MEPLAVLDEEPAGVRPVIARAGPGMLKQTVYDSQRKGGVRASARLVIADDHSIVLEAYRQLLEPEYDVVGSALNGEELLHRAGAGSRTLSCSTFPCRP